MGARRLRRPLCRAHTELQPRGGGKGVSTDTTGEAQGAPHPDTPAPGRQPRASPAHRPDRSARPASLGPHGAVRLAPACAVPQDKAVAEPVSRLLESTLRSSHLPSKIGALHGVLYVLECDLLDDTAKQLVPALSDYLLSSLKGVAQ